jgi:uncharacterized protein (TIGR02466 family)|tara:strand:+ start:309 stop:878 length:570 start_codon:yes stop_codon:yes gene_type:complete
MARHLIFTQSIVEEKFEDLDLKKEILNELRISEESNNGRIRTNYGGFQTKDIKNVKIIKLLGEKISKLMFKHYKINTRYIEICNLWINKNNKGDFNNTHIHDHCHFSGVYYVNASTNGGSLKFLNDDTKVFASLWKYIEKDSDFYSEYFIKPEENLLILFPSYLKHMVEPHNDEKARISVSFNINLKNG